MSNKTIILSIISFLLVSFLFLAWSEKKQADLNSKDIWMIYFQNPKNKSLDFTIENHSNDTDFSYEILKDKDTVKKENISVKKGESKNIELSIPPIEKAKITIVVQTEKEKKEIYKIF